MLALRTVIHKETADGRTTGREQDYRAGEVRVYLTMLFPADLGVSVTKVENPETRDASDDIAPAPELGEHSGEVLLKLATAERNISVA
jgi:crotonobetainyl-CoA:carnitine CoA-transferase CaiB-like acyl-CoA transferase